MFLVFDRPTTTNASASINTAPSFPWLSLNKLLIVALSCRLTGHRSAGKKCYNNLGKEQQGK
jgi:hypothetical protein